MKDEAEACFADTVRRCMATLAERKPGATWIGDRTPRPLRSFLPGTPHILMIRDPRDVAVSCFMGGFKQQAFAWTHRFEDIAHAWGQSRRVMEHWERTLDIPILEVRYERLVAEPETEFPRIIEFLGLEWDDACREFHTSKRTVRTLSYDQVNRPLYTSSIARHRNYAQWLKGIEFPAYE